MTINAPVATVWEALKKREIIKQYMFGRRERDRRSPRALGTELENDAWQPEEAFWKNNRPIKLVTPEVLDAPHRG
jgi:uncharacterized protein YndB with AHSA1/START domain